MRGHWGSYVPPRRMTCALQPDDQVVYDFAVWRVVDVRPHPDGGNADHLVVQLRRPDGDERIHLKASRWYSWTYFEDEHYPVCSKCGDPVPCREKEAERVAAEAAQALRRFDIPGVCPECGEVVTARQESRTWDENVEVLIGPPVTFHIGRRGCRRGAAEYERKWVAADPDRRTATLSCQGQRLTIHGDGTYECSAGATCTGPNTDHRGSIAACYCEGCRDCNPQDHPGARLRPNAVNRASKETLWATE